MLLATDLDGTFLAGSRDARQRLYQLVAAREKIQLVFVTGRGLESVLPVLGDPTIPTPNYLICDVGATVVDGTQHQAVQPLQSDLDSRWPGEQRVAGAFSRFENLERQSVPQQRRCSYYCKSDALTAELEDAAQALGCELLYSADHYLDVLPAGVNKGSTLQALIRQLQIDPEQVLVAGDTLNDLAMFEAGFKGVCVGQSEGALLQATRSRSRVLHAKHRGAGGILEALAHFGFLGAQGISGTTPKATEPGRAQLVMVYHRLPYEEVRVGDRVKRRRPNSPNGILPTLLSFFGEGRAGSWVAWSIHDPKLGEFKVHTEIDAERYPGLLAARVPLSKREVDIFYKTFSKEAFWPLLHTFWERAVFKESHWQVFLSVNKAFAERTAEEAASGATVWIHDYNLWMVPAFLREMRPDLKIAFFHHTYFPSADVFNVLPWRRQIVGSLLHCDYIGFHIPRQVENFVDVVRGAMPTRIVARRPCAPRFLTYGCAVGLDQVTTEIEVGGRIVTLGAHPVGVDVERVKQILAREDVNKKIAELKERLQGLRLILSIERLDYTKGTLEKLLAFERLLEEQPDLRQCVVLTVVCVPAAPEMHVYRSLKTQIEEAVGRINGRFSDFGWTPVQFFARSLPFEEVVAWYAAADLMWITPLRDGLNLVGKEYVATQGLTGGRGVLVLSEFAGAAAELKGAILTNPHDPRDLIDNIYRGITLGRAETEARMRELFDVVRHYDVHRWGQGFLEAVEASAGAVKTLPAHPSVQDVTESGTPAPA